MIRIVFQSMVAMDTKKGGYSKDKFSFYFIKKLHKKRAYL